jgi:hypothetical protein
MTIGMFNVFGFSVFIKGDMRHFPQVYGQVLAGHHPMDITNLMDRFSNLGPARGRENEREREGKRREFEVFYVFYLHSFFYSDHSLPDKILSINTYV